MSEAPEFSRPVKLDTLGGTPRAVEIEAEPAERDALAKRFGLIAIDALTASATLTREGERVALAGRIAARVVQRCVASGEPVPANIDEPVRLRFVPEGSEPEREEIELSEEDCDTIPYTMGAIDLGEAMAETMVLALDPFPRSPNAENVLREAGVISEEDAGPFAALKGLREKLARGG